MVSVFYPEARNYSLRHLIFISAYTEKIAQDFKKGRWRMVLAS